MTLLPSHKYFIRYCLLGLIAFSLLLIACTNSPKFNTTKSIPITIYPLTQWQERIFSKQTLYSIIEADQQKVLKAHSNDSASMLYKAQTIDLNKTPYLHWQWKVTNHYQDINERSRDGDDYVARIYIAVKGPAFSLYPRAINYVWSSNAPLESHWKNPYSHLVTMVALQNGGSPKQQWISEKRNIKQDLQHFFGEEFDTIEGIAVMTDSDNSGLEATSFYKNIYFSQQ